MVTLEKKPSKPIEEPPEQKLLSPKSVCIAFETISAVGNVKIRTGNTTFKHTQCWASQSLYETIAVSLFACLPPRTLLAASRLAHDSCSATFSPGIFEQKRDCSQSSKDTVFVVWDSDKEDVKYGIFCKQKRHKRVYFCTCKMHQGDFYAFDLYDHYYLCCTCGKHEIMKLHPDLGHGNLVTFPNAIAINNTF